MNAPRVIGLVFAGALALAALTGAEPAPAELPVFHVTATRMPPTPWPNAARVDAFDAETLAHAPAFALDDTLRGAAAFSLFRRSNSLFANPTAQGVSLRGLGPSGASRSLVLLDGIPLNDPFGGWVAWTKLPGLSLDHVEIVRGGGSSVWGNAALGGAVQLFTAPPGAAGGVLALDAGSLGTTRTEFVAGRPVSGTTSWQFGGRWFRTDGPWQYARAQRGPIDEAFDSEHRLAHATVTTRLPSGWRATVGGRVFDEERGNGTPLQRNRSRENALHARFAGEVRPGFALEALAYGQRQHFASGFSSVDATRTSETPSLDQFDVPVTAWGGAIVANLGEIARGLTAFGADLRAVDGETREDFFLSGGALQRRRHTGGRQVVGGVFAAQQWSPEKPLALHVAARVDHWRNDHGHRREWTKATGAVLRADRFADTSGTEFNPSAGVTWTAAPGLVWRASAWRAFRVPTLNELYRPFRIGNVATEANAALRRESVTGGEIGGEISRGAWTVRVGGFHHDLRDGVANVTLASTPALTQRQRLNLDAIRVRGAEATLTWRRDESLELTVDYLCTDARVRTATVAPALVDRRLAQVPRHTATLRIIARPAPAWRIDVSVRALSRQFEDDENQLPLARFSTVDLAAHWQFTERVTLRLAAENALAVRIETARTAAGLVSLAPGRWVHAGVIARW